MPSCFLFSLYQPCSHHHFLQVGPVVTPSSPTTPPPPTCLLRCHSRYFCLCPYVSLSLSIALYVAMLYLSCMSMLCVQRYPPHLSIKVSIFLYIAYLFHHKLCKKKPFNCAINLFPLESSHLHSFWAPLYLYQYAIP